MDLERTWDPGRKSFVLVGADDDFPIQNLPYGVFRPVKGGTANSLPRCGAAIGEWVVDLAALQAAGLLPLAVDQPVFAEPTLNRFAALPRHTRLEVRCALSALLDADNARLRDDAALLTQVLHRRAEVRMCLPMHIGDYTDFYSSREHATNVGVMFRGRENALQPNWLHLPVAYHGRASSVILDGAPIVRPWGQVVAHGEATPEFAPSRALDFELEVGAYIAVPSELGSPVSLRDAEDHVFGLTLVNDWSARDIQRWEYVPLGPFLGKNFATSVSPWIVTLEALEPFRCRGPQQHPQPLPYLRSDGAATFDINLQVELTPAGQQAAFTLTRTNYRTLYWSLRQQIAHHTSNGCPLRTGDLLASGTISGERPDSWGSLLELTRNTAEPLQLPTGARAGMLHDGDTVTMSGWAQGDGYRVGFGAVGGQILPAQPASTRLAEENPS